MTRHTVNMFRLEVKPVVPTKWLTTWVWNPRADQWDRFVLRRGKWFTAHLRKFDRRFVFTAGPVGTTTRLMSFEDAKRGRRQMRRLGFRTRIKRVKVERWPHLRGDLDFSRQMGDALDKVAQLLGETIDVISGGRTMAEQQQLYDLYLAGKGNLAAVPNRNAPHIRKIAGDCYVRGVPLKTVLQRRGLLDDARRIGIHFPVTGEAWHAELV